MWNAVFILLLLCFVQPVAALGFFDVLAICLGLVIAILATCACIGWYARRKGLVI